MFSQMILKKRAEKYNFKEGNPFAEDGEQVASVGYRYRKWDMGDGITVVARYICLSVCILCLYAFFFLIVTIIIFWGG